MAKKKPLFGVNLYHKQQPRKRPRRHSKKPNKQTKRQSKKYNRQGR